MQNFESFKIQKFVDVEAPEKEPESELEKLRKQALKVIEEQKINSSDDEEELNLEESILETTTMSVIEDMGETDTEENKDDLKIETSTGNDILIENLKRRRNKH